MSNDKVNWKQARVDAAISAMQGIIANSHDMDYRITIGHAGSANSRKLYPDEMAKKAVLFADALIAELKKTNETE